MEGAATMSESKWNYRVVKHGGEELTGIVTIPAGKILDLRDKILKDCGADMEEVTVVQFNRPTAYDHEVIGTDYCDSCHDAYDAEESSYEGLCEECGNADEDEDTIDMDDQA